MQPMIMYKKGENSWARWIRKRISLNLNFLSLATGPTGVGKSWGMISLACKISPDFEAKQVAFSFKHVMQILNSSWFKEKKYKIIVFDEAQITISNRDWQSKTNKLMNYLLSTFRHQNVILLFTTPYSDFLDSASMKLIHVEFEMLGVDQKKKITRIRPYILQYNSKMKKYYRHTLNVIRKSRIFKMPFLNLPKPPKNIIIEYEQAKTEFTSNLNAGILKELQSEEKKANGDTFNPEAIKLTPEQRKVYEVIQKGDIKDRKELHIELTACGLNSNSKNMSLWLKALRKKGAIVNL